MAASSLDLPGVIGVVPRVSRVISVVGLWGCGVIRGW
jgi:hypothetical protein